MLTLLPPTRWQALARTGQVRRRDIFHAKHDYHVSVYPRLPLAHPLPLPGLVGWSTRVSGSIALRKHLEAVLSGLHPASSSLRKRPFLRQDAHPCQRQPVSNNPCQESLSAWLLSRRFFDNPHSVGLLTSPALRPHRRLRMYCHFSCPRKLFIPLLMFHCIGLNLLWE